jgi:hypothetical protein
MGELLRMQMLAGLITESEYKDILKESKKVGMLYHSTPIRNIENILKQGIKFSNPQEEISSDYFISTTRSSKIFRGRKGTSLIILDGDTISNHYKIIPIQASTFLDPNVGDEWFKYYGVKHDTFSGTAIPEERILSKSPGYLSPKYILDVINY